MKMYSPCCEKYVLRGVKKAFITILVLYALIYLVNIKCQLEDERLHIEEII